MKANDTELVHKTVAELFDMVKEKQQKIEQLEAVINKVWNAVYDEKEKQTVIDILESCQ